ncbi:MAG TPA: DHHA1 domain-containing protein, partial [Blastocatellia bacterium]|nr:DHHA1 domain-containing protein [Blastocatellia bacterium]
SVEEKIARLTEMLKTSPEELPAQIERWQAELARLRREVDTLRLKLAGQAVADALERVREVNGVKVLAEKVENLDAAALRELADRLLNKLSSGVVVLGQIQDGKAALVVRVSRDLTSHLHAGKIIKELAAIVGGRGGGRAELAEAGGRAPEKLPEALEAAYRIVADMIAPKNVPEKMEPQSQGGGLQ